MIFVPLFVALLFAVILSSLLLLLILLTRSLTAQVLPTYVAKSYTQNDKINDYYQAYNK